MLSLAEFVVRRGLNQDRDYIIGPANVKMKRPTQRAIYDIFMQLESGLSVIRIGHGKEALQSHSMTHLRSIKIP